MLAKEHHRANLAADLDLNVKRVTSAGARNSTQLWRRETFWKSANRAQEALRRAKHGARRRGEVEKWNRSLLEVRRAALEECHPSAQAHR